MAKGSNRAMRNLSSAGYSAAKFTGSATEKVFRYMATDHYGMGDALSRMPKMGFVDSIRYLFVIFLIQVACSILAGVLFFILIAFVIPFIIFGTLK